MVTTQPTAHDAADLVNPVTETVGWGSTRFERDLLPHLERLYSTALQMTDSPVEAEDLVQETFANAYVLPHQIQPGTNLREWLYGILITTYADNHQPRQRRTGQGPVGKVENRLATSAGAQSLASPGGLQAQLLHRLSS